MLVTVSIATISHRHITYTRTRTNRCWKKSRISASTAYVVCFSLFGMAARICVHIMISAPPLEAYASVHATQRHNLNRAETLSVYLKDFRKRNGKIATKNAIHSCTDTDTPRSAHVSRQFLLRINRYVSERTHRHTHFICRIVRLHSIFQS